MYCICPNLASYNAFISRRFFCCAGLSAVIDGTRAWLVYGCSIYGTAKGQRLGTLDLGQPLRQWVTGETCYVYRFNERGVWVLNAVKINVEKLRGMLKE